MNLDSFELAQALYYLLLIVFLFLGLFSHRHLNLSKTVKYMVIWSAIALILVIAYSYRYELRALKSRVLGVLLPSTVQVSEQNQIIIHRSINGHFYINSKINGHFVRFMIDTGASFTSMNIKDARRVGINTNNLTFNKRYETANGPIFAAYSLANKMTIGNVKLKDVPISVTKTELRTPLLGINILKQFSRFEIYQDKLILTP